MLQDIAWYAYIENPNRRSIEEYNIFEHGGFRQDCEKYLKECNDIQSFSEKVKGSLRYYFWSRCEYEIVLTGWPCPEYTKDRKIDIYQQVMLNYTPFINFIWNSCKGE